MSEWTVISDDFDMFASESQEPLYDDEDQPLQKSTDFGQKLTGPMFTDQMCLISSGEPGDTKSNRLCLPDYPFIRAAILSDDNSY